MGFKPTIIIDREDLEEVQELLESSAHNSSEEYSAVCRYLLNILKEPFVQFKEYQLCICQPELSGQNELVRDELTDLGVYYEIDN